jgi:hypothetical protein
MTLRQKLLFAALALAAGFAFFGDKTPDIAEPVARASGSAVTTGPAARPQQAGAPAGGAEGRAAAAPIMALQMRDSVIRVGRSGQDPDALFNSQSWTPPPPPPPPPQAKIVPPPPMAPALSYTYLGKKIEDGVWEVYLARGEKTFIVRAHSILEGNYQVDSIVPPTLSLTYLPLKQVQRITIGGSD